MRIKPHPGFSTKAIHIGSEPDPIHGMVVPSIGLSTTYAQKSPGVMYSKYDYSRVGNPTRDAFERCLASLEFANYCIATSSGCAAMTTILLLLETGDHVKKSSFSPFFLISAAGHRLRRCLWWYPKIHETYLRRKTQD